MAAALLLSLPTIERAQAGTITPEFILPNFFLDQPSYTSWEYSRWDRFYSPSDSNNTLPNNRNYPNSDATPAAPGGYVALAVPPDAFGPTGDLTETFPGSGVFTYTGPFTGDWVWDQQLYSVASAPPHNFPLGIDPDADPSNPNANFHPDNPTIRQHNDDAIITSTDNLYGLGIPIALTLEDSVSYTANTVLFQFQTQGGEIDPASIMLNYNDGSPQSIPPTDFLIERLASSGPFGFTFTTRYACQWDLTGRNVSSYTITYDSFGSACSFQQAFLDTTNIYVADDAVPTQREFTGASGNSWNTSSNWEDINNNNTLPAAGANVTVTGGNELNLGGSNRSIGLLKIDTGDTFTINGTSSLETNTGLEVTDALTPKTIAVNTAFDMGAYNFFDPGLNITLQLNGSLSGNTGITKTGPGILELSGNNTFTGAIFLDQGTLLVSGNNTYGINPLTDKTYVFNGVLSLLPTGVLGSANTVVRIGNSAFESAGSSLTSRINVQGERTFSRDVEFTEGDNPKILAFANTGSGTTCSSDIMLTQEFFLPDPINFFRQGSDKVILEVTGASDLVTFTGDIEDPDASPSGSVAQRTVTKTGAGTAVFTGATKDYHQKTIIAQGTLRVEPSGAITNQNDISVDSGARLEANANLTLASGKTLKVDGTLDGTGSLTLNGATVSGSGSIDKAASLDSGDTISPGSSTGSLTFNANQTWGPGAAYTWEINDTTNGPEGLFGHDRVLINGTLNITATSGSPIAVNLNSLDFNQAAGNVHNWNTFDTHQWPIVTATGGITGFDATHFTINSIGITNTLAGSFSLTADAQNIYLNYTPSGTPTPSYTTWAASLTGPQGKMEDADDDGVLNLAEFGSGRNGNNVEDGGNTNEIGIDTSTPDEPRLTITFLVADPGKPGVTIEVLASEDLSTWTPIASKIGDENWLGSAQVTEGSTNPNGQQTVTVTDTEIVNAASANPRFLTVRFSSSN
ncbi:MAG: autotransporter-associated beta strand repeat-containing protein [Verrucomicrobiota bacterium]